MVGGSSVAQALARRIGVRYRWVILFLCALGVFQVTFHAYAFSTLLPTLMGELGIGNSLAGSLLSAYFVTYGLVQIPIGYIADRLGSRRVMLVSLAVFSVGVFLVPLTVNYLSAIVTRLVVGLGASAIYVPGLRIVPNWFPQRRLGLVFGMISSGSALGTSIALFLIPALAEALGWRAGLLIAALGVPAVLLLVWLFLYREPAQLGLPADPALRAGTTAAPVAFVPALRSVLGNRYLYPYGIGTAIYYGGFAGIAAWVPTFLIQDLGYPNATAGLIAALFPLANIVTAPLAGALADRTGQRRLVFAAGIGATGVAAVLFTLLAPTLPMAGHVLLMLIFSVSTSATVLTFSILPNLVPAALQGTAVGLMNSYYFIGAVLYPPLLGAVVDVTGQRNNAFYTIAIFALLGVLIVLRARERLPAVSEPAATVSSATTSAGAAPIERPGLRAEPGGSILLLTGRIGEARVLARIRPPVPRGNDDGPAPGAATAPIDAGWLPYFSASFEKCEAVDVLSALSDPRRGLRELVRVTRSGGCVVLSESDWESLVVWPGDPAFIRRLTAVRLRPDSSAQRLPDPALLAREAGLEDAQLTTESAVWTDLRAAEAALDLTCWVAAAVRCRTIDQHEADCWLAELGSAAGRGDLLISVNRLVIRARRR